jgi:hypothetical protein
LSPFTVSSGVPQGSALGPVLFNIFVNDICNIIKHSGYYLLMISKFSKLSIVLMTATLLQAATEHIQAWCAANYMKLNISKTRVITFSKKTNGLYYVYKIQDSSITHTDTIKDLGVLLDSKFRFHAHTDYIFSQSNRTLGLITTLTYFFLLLTAYCYCIQH